MNVCKFEDLVEIESENNINQTINEMFYLLDASEVRINAIKNQKWFQRMIFSVFGRNKASLKEIAENKDKLNKYVAEAITEMYKRNMISESYLVSLGNRINEISFSNVSLRRQLLEIGSALNEKIESVDHYHIVRGLIDEGKFNDYPELYALIFITSSCDKRVLIDDDHVWLLEKSLKKAGMLSKDLVIAEELKAISELPIETIEGALIETNRTVFDKTLIEIFSCLDTLNSADSISSSLVISGEKLFNLLIEDKKNYFEFLENKKQEQIVETERLSDEIDLANVVGVYNRNLIPQKEDFLKKRDIEGVLVIEDKITFSKEELHIKNQIICNATLFIEDSIIYINENIQGKIIINNGATIRFTNCVIISANVTEKTFIENNDGFVVFDNSVLKECNHFMVNHACSMPLDSRIELNHCDLLNTGFNFMYDDMHAGPGELDYSIVEILNCKFLWMENSNSLDRLTTLIEKGDIISNSQRYFLSAEALIRNCSFGGNSFNNIWLEIRFIDSPYGKKTKISGCIFNKIFGNLDVESISNSEFINAELSIETKAIESSKFLDCIDVAIKGSYDGDVVIADCSFKNIRYSDSSNDSALITLKKNKGYKTNVIKHCSFENIDFIDYIIVPEVTEAKNPGIVINVDGCSFTNCNVNKSLIKTDIHTSTFFLGREKEFDNVVSIRNCTGI